MRAAIITTSSSPPPPPPHSKSHLGVATSGSGAPPPGGTAGHRRRSRHLERHADAGARHRPNRRSPLQLVLMQPAMMLVLMFAALLQNNLPLCCLASIYDGESDDVQIFESKADFNSRVLRGDEVWMVQFYAPWCGHCKNLQPIYKQVASILKGIVKVGAVDAASEGFGQRLASSYDVKGFPTIKIFAGDEKDRATPFSYEGARETEPMVQAAVQNGVVQQLEKRANGILGGGRRPPGGGGGGGGGGGETNLGKVVTLTTSTFQSKVLDSRDVWLVAFIAPWCGHCKALLPDWAAASTKLDGHGVFLGTVDATVETQLAAEYGVKGYPTIKVFPGGEGKAASSAQDYQGGRTTEQIVQAALAEVDRSGVPKEIPELTGPDVLTENCSGPNTLCVLVALPHILESAAAGRNKYKDTIAAVAKSFRGTPFQFVWFEGSSQPALEEALELTFGFPAVVALSMDRNAYAVLRGSFTEKSISKFLHSITSGRQPTVKLRGELPDVVTVEPWDGQDGTPIEEEPLEDIMGWDDEM